MPGTISNLDEQMPGKELAPSNQKYENTQNLSFNDNPSGDMSHRKNRNFFKT